MANKTYNAPRVVSRFMRSNKRIRVIMGPIGSGKSVGCVMEVVRRCREQVKGTDGFRRSRWAIVRNTRQQLKDTTLKTWFDWVPPGIAGRWKESEMTFFLEFGDVKAEILFRALDSSEDVRKVLSLELTGAWLNEARELPREIVEGIDSRLKRYPSQIMGGSNYWALIADTNPPEIESYWYNIIEHLPTEEGNPDSVMDCDTFIQPSGLDPLADNKENLDPTYYSDLAKGKTREWIDVHIHAQYAQSQAGKPVYQKSFKSLIHVAKKPLIINPHLPIVAGMDFGRTPAVVFKQMQPTGQLFTLRSIPEFDMDVKTFMKRRFTPMVKTTFPTNPVLVIGDPSGVRQAESDSGTCFREIKNAGYKAKPARTNDPVVRINATEQYLLDFPGGDPTYQIDLEHNKFLVDALRSKYRFDKKKTSIGGDYHGTPAKNKWSHIAEANQYADLFFLSGRYDPADFVRFDDNSIFHVEPDYGPADSYAGY